MPLKPSFPVSPCPRCPKSRRSVCHCFLKHVPASAAAAEDDSAMVRTRCAVCCEKRPNVFLLSRPSSVVVVVVVADVCFSCLVGSLAGSRGFVRGKRKCVYYKREMDERDAQ